MGAQVSRPHRVATSTGATAVTVAPTTLTFATQTTGSTSSPAGGSTDEYRFGVVDNFQYFHHRRKCWGLCLAEQSVWTGTWPWGKLPAQRDIYTYRNGRTASFYFHYRQRNRQPANGDAKRDGAGFLDVFRNGNNGDSLGRSIGELYHRNRALRRIQPECLV